MALVDPLNIISITSVTMLDSINNITTPVPNIHHVWITDSDKTTLTHLKTLLFCVAKS